MVSEFTEKFFFLKAFQGLTLTVVLCAQSDLRPGTLHALVNVLQDLLAHRVKVLILYQDVASVGEFMAALDGRLPGVCKRLCAPEVGGVPAALWRSPAPLTTLGLPTEDPARFLHWVARLGALLRLPRVLLMDRSVGQGWCDAAGVPLNFINYSRLKKLLFASIVCPDQARCGLLLRTVQELLTGGVGAVSLCRLEDLETELFSYEGQGIFFSRRHYCQVRRLTLDDFSQAATVIRRGEKEGFLLPRGDDEVTRILLHGYGAFLAEHHLSGVCGLVTEPYQMDNAGEITSLYALTRFHGEGVGGRLIARLVQEAKRRHLDYLFACVGDQRAVDFFLHHGFDRVACDRLPTAKWHHYDPVRKTRITCLYKVLQGLGQGV